MTEKIKTMNFNVENVSAQEVAQAMISLAIEGIPVVSEEFTGKNWSAFSEFVNDNEYLFHCDFLADDGSEEAACRLCLEIFEMYKSDIEEAWNG